MSEQETSSLGTPEGGDPEGKPAEGDAPEGIDYSGTQEEIDAAKQKARDADTERLNKEHGLSE